MNRLGEITLGLFMGILCGFFIMYSLQPQRPYPPFVLNILYYPWIIVILLLCIVVLFYIDERAAFLLSIIFLFFVINIFFIGKERTRLIIEDNIKPKETNFPINSNDATLIYG